MAKTPNTIDKTGADTAAAAPEPEVKPEEKPLAKAVKAAAAAPAPRKVSPIIVSRWSEAAFIQQRHAIIPEAGTEPDDLVNPAYYANIAGKLKAGDIIEARPADGRFYVELYVWAKGEAWAQVSVLRGIDRPGPSVVNSSKSDVAGFTIEFLEGGPKHRIVRDADQVEISRGFDTPAAANAWLRHNKDRVAA